MDMLYNIKQVIELIKQKRVLVLAGPEALLNELPAGSFIGGSCYYFINKGTGERLNDRIFVYDLTDYIKNYKILTYNDNTLKEIYTDAFRHGFSYIIVPFKGTAHTELAANLPDYVDFASKPLYGFVSGVVWEHLSENRAVVVSGLNKFISNEDAVVLHVELPENMYAEVDIIDPFEPDATIECRFPETSFIINEAYVNNECVNFATFLKENKKDLRFPLMCSEFGAKVNVSFIELKNRTVVMASPVFKGATYYFAKVVNNYGLLFKEKIEKAPAFSCNCILNYQYMGLHKTIISNHLDGPTTFGEIAYRLLNQTLANLYIMHYDTI